MKFVFSYQFDFSEEIKKNKQEAKCEISALNQKKFILINKPANFKLALKQVNATKKYELEPIKILSQLAPRIVRNMGKVILNEKNNKLAKVLKINSNK